MLVLQIKRYTCIYSVCNKLVKLKYTQVNETRFMGQLREFYALFWKLV